mmetsp:Transcript_37745/g.97629  ORF Transcript_37745/g.97629 Transcript_37745/m.97629 type:complete len:104 (-) Transcript_37745:538-849(-)
MLEDVYTVALIAAGHRVAPAAGSMMERKVDRLMARKSPSAFQGSAHIGSKLAWWTIGSIGSTRDKGTAITTLARERIPTGMSVDFRAHTNEQAWKQPESKARQ